MTWTHMAAPYWSPNVRCVGVRSERADPTLEASLAREVTGLTRCSDPNPRTSVPVLRCLPAFYYGSTRTLFTAHFGLFVTSAAASYSVEDTGSLAALTTASNHTPPIVSGDSHSNPATCGRPHSTLGTIWWGAT